MRDAVVAHSLLCRCVFLLATAVLQTSGLVNTFGESLEQELLTEQAFEASQEHTTAPVNDYRRWHQYRQRQRGNQDNATEPVTEYRPLPEYRQRQRGNQNLRRPVVKTDSRPVTAISRRAATQASTGHSGRSEAAASRYPRAAKTWPVGSVRSAWAAKIAARRPLPDNYWTRFTLGGHEPVDLKCLKHTGVACDGVKIGSDLMHSCAVIADGDSDCIGGECICAEDSCSTSTGMCHSEENKPLPKYYRISTEQNPFKYLKVIVDHTGQTKIGVSEDPGKEGNWRILRRPEGGHLLTTEAYPFSAIDFYQLCENPEQCHIGVGVTTNPKGSEIATQLKKINQQLVLADAHSDTVMYFDFKRGPYAMGCSASSGFYDCPGKHHLIFDPPLTSEVLDNLEDADLIQKEHLALDIMIMISVTATICVCFYRFNLNVKGTRFPGKGQGGVVMGRGGDDD